MFRILLFLMSCLCAVSPASSADITAVRVGAKIVAASSEWQGKRIGLITNHTAVVDGRHVADLFRDRRLIVTALFAPEHGIRGTAEDGKVVPGGTDHITGAVIHSLYGETKKPTKVMLKGVDLLFFDIQDIGVRFYTYISTMGLAMQAAAEAGIPFVVLDRPNPLGGDYVSGFLLENPAKSFVGMYPIPVAHGLTAGELALMIRGEGYLPGLEGLDLRVVRMEGWRRSMRWPETGLPWLPTSPNIPDFQAALLYPGVCLFEGTTANEGRGTPQPFRVVGFPGMNADAAVTSLKNSGLAGMEFRAVTYTPRSLPGFSSSPKHRNRELRGVELVVVDPGVVRPVETGVHLLSAVFAAISEEGRRTFIRERSLQELSGTLLLGEGIGRKKPAEIIASWGGAVASFTEMRKKYLLYD